MASASPSPSDSLLNLPGQSRGNNSRERLHKLPALQNSTILPRPPVPVPDIQSLLNRSVKRKEPSLKHLQARQQMYFPGWDTRSPSSQQTEPPHRQRQKYPVHLPPLQSTTKANPGGYNQSPSSRPTKQPREKKQPVHLPPLQYRNKLFKNVPTPSHPKGPLYTVEVYEYSKDDYLMVTHKGVVSVYEEDYDFITHERWEEEYEYHCELSRIPFFALFKKLKPFHVWRTTVRWKKIHLTRKSLQNRLFFVNQPLRSALIDIRKMCYQISDTGLFHIEKKHTYTLQEFQDVQYKQLQEVSSNLRKFQDLVKEVTVSACTNYLPKLESRSHKLNEQKDKKSLPWLKTFQSSRLICFIRLVDYLVVNALHVLVVNVVTELLAVLQEQVRRTPSHGIIQSWNQPAEAASDPTEEQTEKKSVEPETRRDPPMFTSELMLDPHALTYKPSEENFQESFAEIIGGFKKAVMSVTTLTADPDLDSLTDPGDYEKVERNYEESPYLESLIENDDHLQSMIQDVKESLHFAFDAAKVYSHTFERFRLFYKENESLDLDAMRQQDHGLSFFEKALDSYHREHKEALAIQQKRHLGLLLVDNTELKEKLVSSPLRCLEVISEMFTKLAKKKAETAIAEAREAQFKLECSPSTTAELDNYLTFLDEIKERITVLEGEQETICQMIDRYSVPFPLEDLIIFGTLQPTLSSLHSLIDEAVEERQSTIDKLCSSLQKNAIK